MKKLLLTIATLASFALTAAAGEPGPYNVTEPAAAAQNAPNESGPKKDRQEMKRELHKQIREKAAMVHAKILEACSADIATAGCSGKEGPEMMRCMRIYKESHKDFKPSDACREAMGEGRELRKEKREMKKDLRHRLHQNPNPPPTSGTTPAGP